MLRAAAVWIVVFVVSILTVCVAAQKEYTLSDKCTQVDPGFAYFHNRSLDSIADELKANGYSSVCITSTGGGKFPLAETLVKNGIQARLLIVPMNGTYTTSGLPNGWEKWKIVCKDPNYHEFEYFCLNDADFRNYKRTQLIDTLLQNPAFTAIDLPEPQVPSIGGPEHAGYACFCEDCRKKFFTIYPEETALPNFTDSKSPEYWKTNSTLYEKWVDFRVRTVVDFLDFLVNSPGGIRERCPKVKIITWTLGCQSRGEDVIRVERETQGMDAAAVVAKVKPDIHCIQTDWPDWSIPKLPANHVKKYEPYLASIRTVNKKIPVIVQTDSGSLPAMHRSFKWLEDFDKIAKEVGFAQTFDYQYHLAEDFYTKAPALTSAKLSDKNSTLTLSYSMYIDPDIAANRSNYRLSKGKILGIKADGNRVILNVTKVMPGAKITVTKAANMPAKLIHTGYKQTVAAKTTIKISTK